MLPILLFFLRICSTTSSQPPQHYLKLPLFRATPFPTPQQALPLDSLRLSSLSSSSSSSVSAPIVSGASTGAGQYFVDFHLGSPPQRLHLVADTGSDLLWVHCSACRDCSLHPPSSSFFLPRHSSSFSPFHCFHPSCLLVPSPSPSPPCPHSPFHTPCRYRYSYADRSSTSGFFSHDTAVLNSTRLTNLPFGCAFNVSAGPSLTGAHGVMGLGRGPISFSSHAGKLFGNTFSYCLMDYTLSPPPTSYLLIGGNNLTASVTNSSSSLRFTPLLSNPLSPTFYYVRVLAASVDGAVLPIRRSVWALDRATGGGGTIVDSGTTLSFLPEPAYRRIVKAMRRKLPRAATVAGPPGFDLCLNISLSAKGIRLPKLSLKLMGGAELSPPPRNYFVEAAEGVRCLAMQPVNPAAGPGFGVIGNLLQQGFLFVFDRDADRLGFAHTGCAAR